MLQPNERPHSLPPILLLALVVVFAAVLGGSTQPAFAQTLTVWHRFAGFPLDGRSPTGVLVRDSAGNLYGTTETGGKYGGGILYKINPTGKETVLFNFFRAPLIDFGLFPVMGAIIPVPTADAERYSSVMRPAG
jgi:uncharacterized repeat protein (TIGR03803 family)